MNTTSKWLAIVAVAFVAGSFVASPELRAFAANTVFSSDITDGEVKTADLANNAVTAAKVKDGEIKAAEIATDAVGAAELQGVTKLIFAQCSADSTEGATNVPSGTGIFIKCTINGVDADDSATASQNSDICFFVGDVALGTDEVNVAVMNNCGTTQKFETGNKISIIVFDK